MLESVQETTMHQVERLQNELSTAEERHQQALQAAVEAREQKILDLEKQLHRQEELVEQMGRDLAGTAAASGDDSSTNFGDCDEFEDAMS